MTRAALVWTMFALYVAGAATGIGRERPVTLIIAGVLLVLIVAALIMAAVRKGRG